MSKCFLYEINSPEEKQFVQISYFIYWLKFIELSETLIFALRKKQNQISLLHVYHHVSTVSLAFLLAKYIRGNLYNIFNFFEETISVCVCIISFLFFNIL